MSTIQPAKCHSRHVVAKLVFASLLTVVAVAIVGIKPPSASAGTVPAEFSDGHSAMFEISCNVSRIKFGSAASTSTWVRYWTYDHQQQRYVRNSGWFLIPSGVQYWNGPVWDLGSGLFSFYVELGRYMNGSFVYGGNWAGTIRWYLSARYEPFCFQTMT